jgi:hypothetical protein
MKNIDLKKVINWLGLILRCPVCQQACDLQNTQIVETVHDEPSNEARILIHSNCEKCKSSAMFNIDITGPDVLGVGMITDLTSTDSKKFSSRDPIHINEVINIHKTLKKFNGDLVKALKK